MFPKSIADLSPRARRLYALAVPFVLLVWLLPLLGVALTSVRPASDLAAGNYFGAPSYFAFENYVSVFTGTPLARYMFNSLLITLPTVAGALVLASLAGFALAVYNFRLNVLLFVMFVAGNFVPFQILMVPVRQWTLQTGLYDSIGGLVVFHIAFQTGFCTLFMRNFIKALPTALIESARVEGVSEWRIFVFVVVPLVRPAIAALSVLVFTFVWNDYFWATVLVQSNDVMPVTAGLHALKGQWVAAWQLVAAGSIVAAIPPAVMFILMQKHFVAGLTLGATKG